MPRDGKTNRAGQAAILEPDELQALLYELDDPHKAIASICYLTAGRVGEVLQLREKAKKKPRRSINSGTNS